MNTHPITRFLTGAPRNAGHITRGYLMTAAPSTGTINEKIRSKLATIHGAIAIALPPEPGAPVPWDNRPLTTTTKLSVAMITVRHQVEDIADELASKARLSMPQLQMLRSILKDPEAPRPGRAKEISQIYTQLGPVNRNLVTRMALLTPAVETILKDTEETTAVELARQTAEGWKSLRTDYDAAFAQSATGASFATEVPGAGLPTVKRSTTPVPVAAITASTVRKFSLRAPDGKLESPRK